MEIDKERITEGYRERIERLALFDPLYQLGSKKMTDQENRPMDGFGLGLMTLLFFFECMVSRKKKTGVRELSGFLYAVCKDKYSLEVSGYEALAVEIVRTFRPASGKRISREYYNWETGEMENVQFSLLKTSGFSTETNSQYYQLDEKGLELVFATKEYYMEFHLSINQLLLRKQLEKGEFVSALRQIDEMRMDVQTLSDKINRIKHEILRNIVSEETYERYKTIVEDISLRMQHEDEEFEELQGFIRETRKRIGDSMSEKEQKTYELVLQIDRELTGVHNDHRKLFEESIDLKNTALDAAMEALYHIGIHSFNFKDQITGKLTKLPLPLETSYRLAEPFLSMKKLSSWAPVSVFQKQRLEKDGVEQVEASFPEVEQDKDFTRFADVQRANFEKILEQILLVMGNRNETTLKEVVAGLSGKEAEAMLDNRSFYDFWIILHQRSPLLMNESHEGTTREDREKNYILDGILSKLRGIAVTLSVVELEEEVPVSERYRIRNMQFVLEKEEEDEDGGIQ